MYCSEVPLDKFNGEARMRQLKGQVLKSVQSYRSPVNYIHKPTLQRHVGADTSFHGWCKKFVQKEKGIHVPSMPKAAHSVPERNQRKVDEQISSASKGYYEKLFRSVLYLVEEELAFNKLKGLMDLQMRNGVRFGTTDKINNFACVEMVDIICEVIVDMMKGFFKNANFVSLTGDASEARKTSEEKELVYGKLLVEGFKGYVPCTFLLRCQSLKKFGGGTASGTFEAMKDAVLLYVDAEKFKQMLICLTADGASVNFGKYNGALKLMSEFVGWEVFRIHCANHRLELSMKDAFIENNTFLEIKEMLDTLYRMFRNSGKSWRLYQLVGESMAVRVLRFIRCGGTRFQTHTRNALANFLRNFLVSLLFVENCEEQGNGKHSLVTKEMYPKIVGYRKKWSNFEFIGSANLYYQVLKETAHLSLLMQSDNALIYHVWDAVKETCNNLRDIQNDDNYDYFPFNIEEAGDGDIHNWMLEKSIKIKVSAVNSTLKTSEKLKGFSEEEAEKLKVTKETFTLQKVESGKVAVDNLRNNFIPTIIDKIESRFANSNEFDAFRLFNISVWSLVDDTEEMCTADANKIDTLAKQFETPLSKNNFDIKEAKKEWKKVSIIVI